MDPHEIVSKALSEGRKKLLEHEAMAILEHFGIPVAPYGFARSEEEAVEIAEKIGYPVVLKIVSPDIAHKSDVGGVILDVKSAKDAREAYSKIMENVRKRAPSARIVGVLVQEMVPWGLEVIVGATRDNTFGPVIMFGLGGIFVEVLKDVSFRVAPLTEEDADSMIREIKSYRILEGYRGMPPRDLEAIKKIIMRTSELMLNLEEVQDLDLNPIMLYEKGRGAVVVDARIILRTTKGVSHG